MSPHDDLHAFGTRFLHHEELGFSLDLSDVPLDEAWLDDQASAAASAMEAMHALEKGSIANPDEQRQVGHYWLRDPDRAPEAEQGQMIRDAAESSFAFAKRVLDGAITAPGGGRYRHVISVGIGGSALGPQLVSGALAGASAPLALHFVDNTDPDGIDAVLSGLDLDALMHTLVLVTSKSGGTKETRNGLLEVRHAFESRGLPFAERAVAVTGVDSALDRQAASEGWLARFPMWDWVGGRTSVTSVVGLLPAALQGLDVGALLAGARSMDAWTRLEEPLQNPALAMALSWLRLGNGRGDRAMVVLPYKDRLDLIARYLQQLVMESIGKAEDLQGKAVHQGLTVYGNKGSTDQHAFVQQLRDGRDDFFACFVEVLRDRAGGSIHVEEDVTSGDYLAGFLAGTRAALADAGRPSMTISLQEVDARSVGALIALFERAVGLYASLIGINAYHQPGVEAGKKAAARVLELQASVLDVLRAGEGVALDIALVAERAGAEDVREVVRLLRRLAVNRPEVVVEGTDPLLSRYAWRG